MLVTGNHSEPVILSLPFRLSFHFDFNVLIYSHMTVLFFLSMLDKIERDLSLLFYLEKRF